MIFTPRSAKPRSKALTPSLSPAEHAAVTSLHVRVNVLGLPDNYHSLGSSNYGGLFSHRSGGRKSAVEVSAGLVPSGGSEGGSVAGPPSLRGLPATQAHEGITAISASSSRVPPCVSIFRAALCSLVRILHWPQGPQLQQDLLLTMSAKTLLPSKARSRVQGRGFEPIFGVHRSSPFEKFPQPGSLWHRASHSPRQGPQVRAQVSGSPRGRWGSK